MNSKSLSVALCALTASFALCATGAGAAAIINGGFEADAASVPAAGTYLGPITGWNGPFGYLESAGYYSATPPEGRIFALVGGGIDPPPYHLSQTITGLTSGSRYTVTFSLASEDFIIPGAIEQVNVWMSTGSASASQIYSAPASSNTMPFTGPLWDHWAGFSYSFVASAASATIDFQQTAATSGSGDTGIDDVSISASGGVPEPATWAMMLVGFAAMGATLRRRRAMVAV